MPNLSEIEILRFLGELTVLLIASRGLGDLMKRIGQAAVIGELLAGVLLGPSVLGHLMPGASSAFILGDKTAMHLLEAFAWTGAIMLLLYVGLETDLNLVADTSRGGMGRTAALVSGCGIVIPFACGLGLGLVLPESYLAAPDQRVIFALFMAVAIAISAVPVIAKILIDLGLLRRELGLLILASGIIDDSIGWLLLSLVAGLATSGKLDLIGAGKLVLEAGLFLFFCYYVGYRWVGWLLRWVDDHATIEHAKFTAMVVVAFGCAFITQAIGIHAVFGAFIAGLMLSRSARLRKSDQSDLEAATMGFLAPIFFAFSGLKTDLTTITGLAVPVIVLGVACAAKIIGCGLGGLLGRLKWREALAVAIGMNARGGMGIIVALIGLSLGVLTPQMYTILIMVAVVTSLMVPPLLTWSLSAVPKRASENERQERERVAARIPFAREGAKLLVLSGGGPHADLAAHLAAALGTDHDASITVFHANVADSPRPPAEFDAQFARIKAIAELSGARNIIQRSAAADTIVEAIMRESERGYDVIFAGASQADGYDAAGGDILHEIVSAARAPVVIARNVGAPMPLRRALVPTTGSQFSRLGATLAMLYCNAAKARLTALYVKETSLMSLRNFYPHVPSAERTPIANEIMALGKELGIEVQTHVVSGNRPENAILAMVERGDFDLLVMGVLFRPVERRLYFGPKVEQILRNARCAVAIVVPPENTRHNA
ncbi:MAG: cation:proton antiporter [Candidatus Binataceae bacterium]